MTELGSNAGEHVIQIPDGGAITLAWGAATDVGRKRTHNEDSLVALPPVFAVADGMGGHAAGDVASDAVVRRLAELAADDFTTPEAVIQALRQATVDLVSATDVEGVGVGTTVTGAVLTRSEEQPQWAVFNIGDSRVYLFEGNLLTQVTVDHSVVQELVSAGLLDPEDAEQHPESNVITRAVGFNAEPMLDVWLLPVKRSTRFLICSDGLSREVDHERLRLHLAAGLAAEETAKALVDAALAAGGRDNITALVVDVFSIDG